MHHPRPGRRGRQHHPRRRAPRHEAAAPVAAPQGTRNQGQRPPHGGRTMKTGMLKLTLTATALTLGLAACVDDPTVVLDRQRLDSSHEHDYEEWPTVPYDDVD